ncbi:MAG: glycosyltransferase family 2 protein [Syntrophales bacterium]
MGSSPNASITVIIVNYNGGDLLRKCLLHLHHQTCLPSKTLLIDNGSSDASADLTDEFTEVTVLRMGENLGFAAANNYALHECNTEFVALLNPDAFPEPDWLENLLTAANDHPELAAFGSRQLCHENPDILDGLGDNYHISGLVWRDRHGAQQQEKDLIGHEIFSPCAAAALYRRQALVDVGGFDEDFFCYVEDVDLGFRLRLAGYKAMYVPNAVVQHASSATTGGQDSNFSVYHGHRNLVWTFVKNMPGALFWLLLPLHVLLNIVSIFLFTVRGQGGVILRAKRDAIRGIKKAWRKRRQIQSRRTVTIKEIWQVLDKRLTPIQK